jgi:hypothetical protein
MNERIEKLIEQCTVQEFSDCTGGFETFDKEKFAELIVAECLDACSRANEIRHFVPPTQEQVVLSCMREIETTFRS